MIQSDCHMHTRFSTDSDAPVHAMLDAACKKGLRAVCITDHLDIDYPEDTEFGAGAFLLDFDAYIPALSRVREEYQGRLTVRTGVEFGMQPHLSAYNKELAEKYPFDFIIGSVHLVEGQDPYYQEIFHRKPDREVYRQFFAETMECLKNVENFDSLGHLDYIVRYGLHREEEYAYRDFADEIDAILRKLVDSGKALEVNTAGLRSGLGFCNPHTDVIRRYRELGGEMVTVGADAHSPEQTAFAFGKAEEILKLCGFSYYTEFVQRTPRFVKM